MDEIKPGVTKEQLKFLAVKSVCKNGTALPVLYSPVDQSSWGPPYSLGRKNVLGGAVHLHSLIHW